MATGSSLEETRVKRSVGLRVDTTSNNITDNEAPRNTNATSLRHILLCSLSPSSLPFSSLWGSLGLLQIRIFQRRKEESFFFLFIFFELGYIQSLFFGLCVLLLMLLC